MSIPRRPGNLDLPGNLRIDAPHLREDVLREAVQRAAAREPDVRRVLRPDHRARRRGEILANLTEEQRRARLEVQRDVVL